MDRRSFLIGMTGVAGAVAWRPAHAGTTTFHVMYPGSQTREEALDVLERVAAVLGPGVAEHLSVARRGSEHIVIYDRSTLSHASDRSRAEDVARRHDALLRASLDEDRAMAVVLASAEIESVWNIRYGEPASEASLRKLWDDVARMLGSGVAKGLVIEQLADDRYQLVYKRMGDEVGTAAVARHHAELLRRHGIAATAVPDAFGLVAFDGTSADTTSASRRPALVEKRPSELDAVVEAEEEEEEEEHLEDDTSETTDSAIPLDLDLSEGTSSLSAQVNAHVQHLRKLGRVSSVERTAWVVYDLAADRTLCAINADRPMQAASMIKPFVAVAFFHEVKRGRFSYGPTSQLHMERMIRDSSNTSTNWFIDQVGGPSAVAAILKRHYGDIARDVSIVERIPAGGRTYLNKASANDHARLLRAIWRDAVPQAAEMRRVMNLPGSDRLYRDVPEIPVGTEVYNKTGTTAMCCGDMGILVARARDGRRIPYIVVGIIERSSRASSYSSWQSVRGDVIRSVSGVTYAWLRNVYDLG